MSEQYLVHYGVQGMRWGFRKKEESGGGLGRQGGLFSKIRDKRNSKKIARFERKNHSADTIEKLSDNMAKRGDNPRLDKAYSKYHSKMSRLQSSYDKATDNAKSTKEYHDLSKQYDQARKQVSQKYQQSVMKEFSTLDTNQKVSLIKETNIQKGMETAGRIVAGGLTVAALTAITMSRMK